MSIKVSIKRGSVLITVTLAPMSKTFLTETAFRDLQLHTELYQGLDKAGFTNCTPIQAETIPVALHGDDVAGQAQTGTGKTAAFLLISMHHLLSHKPEKQSTSPRCIILAPTRELAIQIHKDAIQLGGHTKLKFGLVYGGVDYDKQRKTLQNGVDILIGTPGRIIDYFKQKVFHLRGIEVMILDEADRMFDLGFIKDIRYLLRRMPKPEKRQNMLFSATLSYRVMELAYEHMNDPKKVTIETKEITADSVEQRLYYPANTEKIPLLLELFETLSPSRSIIFTNTKHAARKVADKLNNKHIKAALLSGDVPQKKREKLLNRFKNGEFKAMVATDVAARGIHVDEVSHVFNFDLPQTGEDYVHRIGRTARAGSSGIAISFACEDTSFYLPDIEDYIGSAIQVAG